MSPRNLPLRFARKLSPRILIAALMALLFTAPASLLADTYQILNLGTDANWFFYGMDDSGTAVLRAESGPFSCSLSLPCYNTFVNGASTGYTTTAPTLGYDNGFSCTPILPAGATSQRAVCNNGRQGFSGFLSSGQELPNVYTGPDSASGPLTELQAYSGEGPIFMNSQGDLVWDDHFSETFVEAIDLTQIPEPGSILLLGTGIIAAAGSMRRRLKETSRTPGR